MNKCEKCGHLHYRTDPCRKPRKSTGDPVAKKVVNNTHGTKPLSTMGANPTTDRPVEAGPLPVDTISEPKVLANAVPQRTGAVPRKDTVSLAPDAIQKRKRGRPPTGFDKAEYNRQLMKKKRARLKAEREAAK